jgi:hypothetical protein
VRAPAITCLPKPSVTLRSSVSLVMVNFLPAGTSTRTVITGVLRMPHPVVDARQAAGDNRRAAGTKCTPRVVPRD